jgi:AraC-like DNA-binding protein
MAVERLPGDLRIGVRDEVVRGVGDPGPQVAPPKVKIVVLLAGRQRFELNDRVFAMEGPSALMFVLRRPGVLRFTLSEGAPLRKTSVAAPPDWLTRLCPGAPEGPDLRALQWRPDARLTQLAEDIVAARDVEPALLPLFRAARGLELMRGACRRWAEGEGDGPRPVPPRRRKGEALRDFIRANLARDLTLDCIARETGLSTRSVQRLFKETFGATVKDFIRAERLALADRALRSGEMSVAQAAHLAGYGNAANFSTAFKRAYGQPPARWRDGGGAPQA